MNSKRKGRPLLAGAAGVAFVSFVHCEPQHVGNLRAPDNTPVYDSGAMENDAGTAPSATPSASTKPIKPPG